MNPTEQRSERDMSSIPDLSKHGIALTQNQSQGSLAHDRSMIIRLLEEQRKWLIAILAICLLVIVLLGLLTVRANAATKVSAGSGEYSKEGSSSRTQVNVRQDSKQPANPTPSQQKKQLPQEKKKQDLSSEQKTKKPPKVWENQIDVPLAYEGEHSVSSRHQHNEFVFNYPTVGIPTPGNKYNDTKVKPEELNTFDETFLSLFKPYNDTNCQFKRFGRSHDGGYVLCTNFFKDSEALLNIGVQGQDGLGCDITADNPMPNYQYDCTNKVAPYCSKNNQANHFYEACIGAKSEMTRQHIFYSYEDILHRHNLTDKRITLKIDCEGCEHHAFKAMPLKYLDLIDNIIMEVHLGDIYKEQWGMLDTFKSIADRFVPVNYHNTNWASCRKDRKLRTIAVQLTLVSKKLIKVNSESRSFAMHPSNQMSNVNFQDCQHQ